MVVCISSVFYSYRKPYQGSCCSSVNFKEKTRKTNKKKNNCY
jgi:hypothetical protein